MKKTVSRQLSLFDASPTASASTFDAAAAVDDLLTLVALPKRAPRPPRTFPELEDVLLTEADSPDHERINLITQVRRDLRVLADTSLSTFDRDFFQGRVDACRRRALTLKKVVDTPVQV
jgi:hypothetical protein